jgi:6-phosphofructokinase 2
MVRVITVTPNPALDIWTTTDKFTTGKKLRCTPPKVDPGGGGVNVSRVLHRLGAETLALFAAGGTVGDRLVAALALENLPSQRIPLAQETRESFSVFEQQTSETLRFVLPGPEMSEVEGSALLERLAEVARVGDLVVGSGSLPAGLSHDYWARAAALAERAGCRFLLDSAIGVAPALGQGVYLLRLNRYEILELIGAPLSWPDEVAGWMAQQVERGACQVFVVTHGDAGALMVTRDQRIRVRPPAVRVHSAIGAGDSFVAGLCLGLVRNEPLEHALRLAVATSTAALLSEGTDLCRKEDVERLLAECSPAETL